MLNRLLTFKARRRRPGAGVADVLDTRAGYRGSGDPRPRPALPAGRPRNVDSLRLRAAAQRNADARRRRLRPQPARRRVRRVRPPSERGLRIGCQRINSRFIAYRKALGLDDGLDYHSFRRSYVTHLIEDGWDPHFVQEQVGHEHASTTSIYTCVSSDFRTRTLRRHLDATVAAALQAQNGRQA
ncbi:tyrosine-type recombinase/integrase [Streptomyces sp. HMX87]|uniref:tyrosine-type recombinase/integrase n=1 Tax=Streptomyces sp. HMX87 TaxID=3390849 RepID=UPI003A841E42